MFQWTVYNVFDPDGGGADFAYTVGLASFGHPELHVWARPDGGHDVGADYMLSANDQMSLLNRLGDRLITGEISVGSVIEEMLDGGLTRVVYTLGEPVHPDAVDAFQADEDTQVIPVRWELHRPELAEPTPMRPSAAIELGDLIGIRAEPAPLDAPLGPASALVAAVDARLRAREPLDVFDVVVDLARVPRMLAWLLGVSQVAARTVGRVEAHDAAVDLAETRADRLGAAVATAAPVEDESSVAGFFHQALAATYAAMVVFDALPEEMVPPARSVIELVANPTGAFERLTAREEARAWIERFEHLITTQEYDEMLELSVSDLEQRASDEVIEGSYRWGIGSGALLRLKADTLDHTTAVSLAAAAAVLLADGLVEPEVAEAATAPAQRLFDACGA